MSYNRFQLRSAVLCSFLLVPAQASFAQEKTEEERLNDYIRLAIDENRKKDDLNRARQAFQQHRADANNTYEKLTELSERAKAHFGRVELLLDKEDGKRLAAEPGYVAHFIDIQTHAPLRLEDLEKNHRTVTRILESLRMEPDLIQADWQPKSDDVKELRRIYYWAENTLGELAKKVAELDDMLRNPPAGFDPLMTRTLREAVDERTSLLDALSARADVDAEKLAKVPSLQILIDTAVQKKVEQATTKAKLDLDEARALMDRRGLEYEKRIAEIQKRTDEERNTLQIELAKAKSELQGIRMRADSARRAEETKTATEVQKVDEKTEHDRKKAKAESPEVQELLKSFIAKGYYQPKARSGYESTGVSLKALQSYGALEPSEKGLQNLLEIGRDPRDKERPRFGYPAKWQKLSPQQKAELKDIQNHLIELGEVLVEGGFLAP